MKKAKGIMVLFLMMLVVPAIISAEEFRTNNGQTIEVSEDTAYVLTILRNRQNKATQKGIAQEVKTAPAVEISSAISQPQAGSQQMASENFRIENAEMRSIAKGNAVSTTPPPTVKTEKAQWGVNDKFNEFSLWGGAWKNLDADSDGWWLQGEYYRKYSLRKEPENFGFGIIGKLDRGSNDLGASWGYAAVGPALSYWRAITTEDAIQAKLRLPYRWNRNDVGENGWMPGLYLEYDRILSRNNVLIFSAEGWSFKNDSQLGFNAGIEHRVNRTMKLKAGLGAFWSFQADGSNFGWGPNIGIKLWDKLTIGANLGFSGGTTTVGGIIGYDYNSALANLSKRSRQNAVVPTEQKTNQAPGEVVLSGITIQTTTLAEDIHE